MPRYCNAMRPERVPVCSSSVVMVKMGRLEVNKVISEVGDCGRSIKLRTGVDRCRRRSARWRSVLMRERGCEEGEWDT